jgi:hypothetical protein
MREMNDRWTFFCRLKRWRLGILPSVESFMNDTVNVGSLYHPFLAHHVAKCELLTADALTKPEESDFG